VNKLVFLVDKNKNALLIDFKLLATLLRLMDEGY
jgi:hypothetical protein